MMKVVHCMIEKYDVYIGRPGPFGNPYSHKKGTRAKYVVDTPEEAVARFREYLYSSPQLLEKIIHELNGKVLGCWCKTEKNPYAPCHGDVIVEVIERYFDEKESNIKGKAVRKGFKHPKEQLKERLL